MSPAASAWCATRARSARRGGPARARSARWWSSWRRSGGIVSSIATRSISCRNAMPSRWTRSIPDVRPSSTLASSLRRNLLEQPQLGARRCDRDRVEQGARAGGQPRRAGQDGVAHALGERRPAGGERLGHVERVAAGDPVELGGVDLVRLGQILHRPLRQRLEPQARDGRPRQLAQNSAERVGPAHLVVAVGEDDERRSGLDSAREQADEVERGAVGTVQILEHDHVRRPPAKLVEERRQHARPARIPARRATRARRRSRSRCRRAGRAAAPSGAARTRRRGRAPRRCSGRTHGRGRSCRCPPHRRPARAGRDACG